MPKTKYGKISRRFGTPLSASPSIQKVLSRRSYGPGVQGPKQQRRRTSTFGLQLNEKQKAKLLYDIRERQFRNYFQKAVRRKGNTEDFLMQELESRLDNVVFRMGFAKTRQQARQLVSHKFFSVNGKGVNIRSYKVKPGDEVSLRDTKKSKGLIDELKEHAGHVTVPGWLLTEPPQLAGRMLSMPEGEHLKDVFDAKLIIEFYSR
ncbi:MAG: 30S ribosomal protein S4 [Patescibacteria group bacterium]